MDEFHPAKAYKSDYSANLVAIAVASASTGDAISQNTFSQIAQTSNLAQTLTDGVSTKEDLRKAIAACRDSIATQYSEVLERAGKVGKPGGVDVLSLSQCVGTLFQEGRYAKADVCATLHSRTECDCGAISSTKITVPVVSGSTLELCKVTGNFPISILPSSQAQYHAPSAGKTAAKQASPVRQR